MNQGSPVRHLWRIACRYRRYWLLPVVGSVCAACGWWVWHEPTWQATQGLILRDITSLEDADLGRFPDGESRKIAQEMVLELARRPEVAEAALLAVGPSHSAPYPNGKPTTAQIDALVDSVKVVAPKGAEFGRTDLIYLSVKDRSPRRARQLAAALTTAVDLELRQLRRQQAASLVAELTQVESVAANELQRATEELVELEEQAGPDLGELRVLTQAGSGEGVVRQLLVNLDNDRRAAQIRLERQRNLLAFLEEAKEQPEVILSAPSALFELQPSLGGLKEGLTQAQLRYAQLKGQYAGAHPKLRAAEATVREVRERLKQALHSAETALAQDVHINESQLRLLEQRRDALLERSERIARLRAPYAARIENVRQATAVLQEVRKNLAEAKGRLQAAEDASLITRVGRPTTPTDPTGPRPAVVLLAALLGGLFLGLGNLVLMVPTDAWPGRAELEPPLAALRTPTPAVDPSPPDTPSSPTTVPSTTELVVTGAAPLSDATGADAHFSSPLL